jgi:hypothetical protein
MASNIKQPIRRVTPWPRVNPWGNELPAVSSGNPAKDVFKNLPSKFDAPAPRSPTPSKDKQGR